MSQTDDLKREAELATIFRGHELTPWRRLSTSVREDRWHAYCAVCGKEVVISDNPMPNDIDIGGEAVALNCVED